MVPDRKTMLTSEQAPRTAEAFQLDLEALCLEAGLSRDELPAAIRLYGAAKKEGVGSIGSYFRKIVQDEIWLRERRHNEWLARNGLVEYEPRRERRWVDPSWVEHHALACYESGRARENENRKNNGQGPLY